MNTGGSQGKGRVEIVRYKANGSVDLRGPALSNDHLTRISIPEGNNHPAKTDSQEGGSLAYLRPKTVQPMGVSSTTHSKNFGKQITRKLLTSRQSGKERSVEGLQRTK
jgi:hypothetical protein